jgi:ATP-dependent DNA helicase RecQ
VAYVESLRRSQLTRDLAEGLARYLKLPIVGRWHIIDPDVPPSQGAANSAQRVRAVARRFDLDLDQPLDGGPVLLVDDLVATGWTLTLAARALRNAGSGPVLPLALAMGG